MAHKEITAAVVAEAHTLLAQRIDRTTVAARLGVSEYVTGIIARARRRSGHAVWSRPTARRIRHPRRALDASTIRQIQRMLSVGMLSYTEIAREVGVSPSTVSDVASSKRIAVSLGRPVLSRGERFLAEPIRCSVCGAKIAVAPCRACRASRAKKI